MYLLVWQGRGEALTLISLRLGYFANEAFVEELMNYDTFKYI